MAFEKIKLSGIEKCEDIEYLRKKKYVGLFGRVIPDTVDSYYKDKENNAFILNIGCTNPNFETDGYMLDIFVLCIDGNMIGISAEISGSGDFYENTLEEEWEIKRIVYPEGWKKEEYPNFKELVKNAFEAMTLYRFDKPESVKRVNVVFNEFIKL